ncbi:MAG TPA: arginine repressor [Gemmatimonadaceae bacterium]|nr:arginine repressor [Gemmatimonadaceae bacterium]
MANKRERQHLILEVIRTRVVASQEELRQLLLHKGWDVTQSTLSRDMKELRLARVQTREGVRYTSPAEATEGRHAALSALLPQLFLRLDGVGELLVLKTTAGSAQAAAAVLDSENSPDLVGTLAGDDTVLLICRSEAARERLSRRILQLARR